MATKRLRRNVSTEELAIRIREDLDDLYNGNVIDGRTYNKKRQYVNIMRAINHADRLVCRDITLTGSVIVYVPADTSNVIFSENHLYKKQVFDNIKAQTADIIKRDKNYFLAKEQYLHVTEILDRYLYVFEDYPVNTVRTEARIKKLSEEDYMGLESRNRSVKTGFWAEPYFEDVREDDAFCYYIQDEERLVMQKKFKTASFLKFRARLMPGVLQMQDLSENEKDQQKWDVYRVLAPHWAFETMQAEALVRLTPLSEAEARALVKNERDEQEFGMHQKRPSDSNVIVPHHSW